MFKKNNNNGHVLKWPLLYAGCVAIDITEIVSYKVIKVINRKKTLLNKD